MPRKTQPAVNTAAWVGVMRDLQQRGRQQEQQRRRREGGGGVVARLFVPGSGIRINHSRATRPGGDAADRDSGLRLG